MKKDTLKAILLPEPRYMASKKVTIETEANFLDNLIDSVYEDFDQELKEKSNEIARLRKQLSSSHNLDCNCSFCVPVANKESNVK